MKLRDYIRIFRQRWIVIAVCTAVAALVLFVVTPVRASKEPPVKSYTATATLIVGASAQASPAQAQSSSSLGRVALLVTTGDIPRQAAKTLGYAGDPAVLATQVVVTPDQIGGAVKIAATDTNGDTAATRANAFADATVGYFTEQKNGTTITILERATPLPNKATGGAVIPPGRGARTLLGALVGLLFGLALAIVLNHLDGRLRTTKQIQQALDMPIVADIPRLKRGGRGRGIVVHDSPLSAYADGYRAARSALVHAPVRSGASIRPRRASVQGTDGRARLDQGGAFGDVETLGARQDSRWDTPEGMAVLVTSAFAGEGKTTTVANLAASFAETGQSVIVLDADLRSPDAHELFDVPQSAGISDYLFRPDETSLEALARPTSIEGVRVITAGTQLDHPEALTSRLAPVISGVRQLADVVLVDASPVIGASDGFDILPLVDSVLLVARSGRLTEPSAKRVSELLHRFQVPVTGVVVIGAPVEGSGYGYGYGYGSGYGYGEKPRKGRTKGRRH